MRGLARHEAFHVISEHFGPPPAGQAGRRHAAEQVAQIGPGGQQRRVQALVLGQLGDPGRHQRDRRAAAAARARAPRRRCGAGRCRPGPRPRRRAARRRAEPRTWRSSTPRIGPELIDRRRGALRDAEHGEVGDDEPRREVLAGRPPLPPGGHRPGDVAGSTPQRAEVLEAEPGVLRLAGPGRVGCAAPRTPRGPSPAARAPGARSTGARRARGGGARRPRRR